MADGMLSGNNPLQPGLAIGIPFCGRPVTPSWALSLASQNYPLNCSVMFTTVQGMETGEARDLIVEKALEQKAKYLWMLDDDVAPPHFAIRKLMYALDQQAPPLGNAMVIGGIYCAKCESPTPLVYRGEGNGTFWDWKYEQVFDVTGCGTGCMLIRTEVFAHLEKPWFRTVDEALIDGTSSLIGEIDPAITQCRSQMTDDLYFTRAVIRAGFRVLAHGGVLCVHWDVASGRYYVLPADSYPMRPAEIPQGELQCR